MPLPLTPEAPPPEPTGAVMHSRQALRRASFNAARVDAETDHGVNQGADVTEVGGPKGPEPTRYNDWEQKGRCTDF
ncbi:DUF1674 domain-containing protein [Roseospira marina]|uniref:DUF1674 domain-containing protein n=1 Tax=Roseospira marina TaxID=140057 RepID=A0A5M6I8D7_9PROT|nr:DUF1674 domain-containing protein [Roseospira marina]